MKKVILLIFCTMFICGGCAKPKPRLSVEEEYRLRQKRRMKEALMRREDGITSLSGLNSVEMDELERSKRASDLNPNPGSFVFSPGEASHHGGSDRILKELDEDGQQRLKKYKKSVKQKEKSRRNWVYGL
ncbi:MAG: hypothetical protein IKB77_01430 [Lentisphaeria bacterium]|nr:hypothetical protein [Lentisphaeria bacterium]